MQKLKTWVNPSCAVGGFAAPKEGNKGVCVLFLKILLRKFLKTKYTRP
jgi:hypothetical protein